MKPLHHLKFNFATISVMLARKILGQGTLQLSRRSAQELPVASPGPCKTENPTTSPKKVQIFPKKKRTVGPKIGPNLGSKTGPRNWPLGAMAINFLKEGRILDQFLVQFLGPKSGPRNRKKHQKCKKQVPVLGTNVGPCEIFLQSKNRPCVGTRAPLRILLLAANQPGSTNRATSKVKGFSDGCCCNTCWECTLH